ncbi:hypothetical protein [Actinoplanes sp. N902-109]|uniref:hypothetical protein n=1 Tax=Actinoplanes sp. (strain N902-109) TaxID=649831 RepID=UPI0003295FE0|nr:hypothetical protein [Actinoplanes sp. N902-109]AGL15312.1 hypothetical protein L083_1802 [Actinoplanes sp. N902-109]
MAAKYEVVLSPAAWREIRELRTMQDRDDLADALGKELIDGPNVRSAWSFKIGEVRYTAVPLTFRGWVAIYRELTQKELDRVADERPKRRVESSGFLVFDLLPPHTAFAVAPHSEMF